MAEGFPPSKLARALAEMCMVSMSGLTFRFSFFKVHRPCRMDACKILNFAADGVLAQGLESPGGKRVTYPRQEYHTI